MQNTRRIFKRAGKICSNSETIAIKIVADAAASKFNVHKRAFFTRL
jgi:hypothetical protein